MKTSYIVWIVIVIVVLGGGYWYWSSTQTVTPGMTTTNTLGQIPPVGTPTPITPVPYPTTQTTSTTTTTTTTQTGITPLPGMILGSNTTAALGTFLVAPNGMTLYSFTKDAVGTSTCYGVCSAVWLPYTVASASSKINVPSSIKGTVSTILRTDGKLQVIYNGKPVYYYSKDSKPGDTTGEGIGGTWFVAKS